MHNIAAETLNQSLNRILTVLFSRGKEVTVRGKKTLELHPCCVRITNPKARTLLYPGRGNNPFATLAETLWVLAGRNDVDWLKFFLPRAPDFSDDGKVWRAGYGPRIRCWELDDFGRQDTEKCKGYVDQVKWVVEQLKKDLYTRQAVISIWDPAEECTVEETKDYPCNDWLHFMVRNKYCAWNGDIKEKPDTWTPHLDCEVVVRSNDVLWGYSAINMYEWTVLQEIIAAALGIEVGEYYHYTSSMHLYEQHFDKAKKLAENINYYDGLPEFKFCDEQIDIDKYLKEVESVCRIIGDFIGLTQKYDARTLQYKTLSDCLILLVNFILLKQAQEQEVNMDNLWERYNHTMRDVQPSDLKVSCHYWIKRNIAKEKKYLIRKAIADITPDFL